MFSLSTTNAFGLDISDFYVRLIKIEKFGKKYVIVSQNELELPSETMVLGDVKKPEVLVAAIKKLVATAHGKKIQTNLTITALPEPKTFIKLLQVTTPSLEELPQNLVGEMEKHIPFALDEIFFDWQVLGDFRPNKPMNVLVGVAPIVTVNNFIAVLKGANLLPLALEIESASITRCMLPFKKTDTDGRIIIDMGASRTGLVLYDQGTVQFTMSLNISGNEITKKISEKLEIDIKQAEKAKIICGLDDEKCKGVLRTILMNKINLLMDKIGEAIAFYQENGKNRSVKEIILCGNGASLIALDELLKERLKIPVSRGNPLTNIGKIDKGVKLSPDSLQSYTSAIGLAFRAFE